MAVQGNYAWSVMPVHWLGLVLIVGFSGLCGFLLWRGYAHARFFAVAFGVFYAGLLVGFMRNLGYLPVNGWAEHASAVGTMLHMILLSAWLIGRYERKRRAHERWQANLAREHSVELAREVEQRTADLRQEIQRRELLEQELRDALGLEQRVRTEQQDFIGMVSHEFRMPLAIITTLSQRIEQGQPVQTERNIERCQQIRSAASRLLALVDEYLSDDRMSESQVELKYAPCDLPALLAELSEDFPRTVSAVVQSGEGGIGGRLSRSNESQARVATVRSGGSLQMSPAAIPRWKEPGCRPRTIPLSPPTGRSI